MALEEISRENIQAAVADLLERSMDVVDNDDMAVDAALDSGPAVVVGVWGLQDEVEVPIRRHAMALVARAAGYRAWRRDDPVVRHVVAGVAEFPRDEQGASCGKPPIAPAADGQGSRSGASSTRRPVPGGS